MRKEDAAGETGELLDLGQASVLTLGIDQLLAVESDEDKDQRD